MRRTREAHRSTLVLGIGRLGNNTKWVKPMMGRKPMALRRLSLAFAGVAAMLCLSGPAALGTGQVSEPSGPDHRAVAARRRHRRVRARARQGVRDPNRRRCRGREPRRRQHHPRRQRLQERRAGWLYVLSVDPQHGLDQSRDLPEALVRSAQGLRARHQRLLRPADRDPQQERAGQDIGRAGRVLQKESRQAQLRLDGAGRRFASHHGMAEARDRRARSPTCRTRVSPRR